MERNLKVKNLEELAGLLPSLPAEGRKIVVCHGAFDRLHIGHIRHFERDL